LGVNRRVRGKGTKLGVLVDERLRSVRGEGKRSTCSGKSSMTQGRIVKGHNPRIFGECSDISRKEELGSNITLEKEENGGKAKNKRR